MESSVQSASTLTTDMGVTRPRPQPPRRRARRQAGAFALLAAVQVIVIVAITVIVLAVPAVQRDLGLSRADLLGPRRVLVLGVAVFGLAVLALRPRRPTPRTR